MLDDVGMDVGDGDGTGGFVGFVNECCIVAKVDLTVSSSVRSRTTSLLSKGSAVGDRASAAIDSMNVNASTAPAAIISASFGEQPSPKTFLPVSDLSSSE